MKKTIVLILCCISILFFNGCGHGERRDVKQAVDIRMENSQNMSKINVGMTKDEVIQIMGNKTARVYDVAVTNPYKTELRQSNEGTYEILYYYTHYDKRGRRTRRFTISENELTPIIFKDGKVIGWGKESLSQTIPNANTSKIDDSK